VIAIVQRLQHETQFPDLAMEHDRDAKLAAPMCGPVALDSGLRGQAVGQVDAPGTTTLPCRQSGSKLLREGIAHLLDVQRERLDRIGDQTKLVKVGLRIRPQHRQQFREPLIHYPLADTSEHFALPRPDRIGHGRGLHGRGGLCDCLFVNGRAGERASGRTLWRRS